MPGIFGLVIKSAEDGGDHRTALGLMAAAMRYESFYTTRLYESKTLGVFAGWVGPAEDIANGGVITVPNRGITLLVSGEPCCDAVSTARLLQRDHADPKMFRVVEHYDRSPETFPATTRGLFSGLLIDEPTRTSVLFNDRLGIERLFVYEDDDSFLFASEAKAILAAAPRSRALDPQGFAELVACGSTLREASPFRGIRVLPAGTVLRFCERSAPKIQRYFDRATWEEAEPLPEKEFLPRLSEALGIVIAEYARSSSVAISLTGGLDSRIIMAYLDADSRLVPCYTFGSMYRDTYDVRIARRVATVCRQPHHVLVLGSDFLRGVRQHVEKAVFVSDGYLGLSGAAELYLNKLARQVALVRMTGNYGGELLRGVRAFKASVPKGGFLTAETTARAYDAVETFSKLTSMPALSFTLFCQVPSGFGRYAIERSQVVLRSPFLDERIVRLLYRRPGRFLGKHEPSSRLIATRDPGLLKISTDRGLLGQPLTRKFRHLYREALFKGEYVTGHGAPTAVAGLTRRMPGQLVERFFRGRHKFQHPRTWMRGDLGAYIDEVLLAETYDELAPYVDVDAVKTMVTNHRNGVRNYCDQLDSLLTVSLAVRLLIRSPGRSAEVVSDFRSVKQ